MLKHGIFSTQPLAFLDSPVSSLQFSDSNQPAVPPPANLVVNPCEPSPKIPLQPIGLFQYLQ
jgi:hypothetical protein